MYKKPVIGVMGAHSVSVLYNSVSVSATSLNEAYFKAIVMAGGVPMIIPPMDTDEMIYQLIDKCDGVLFPGGEDVDPRFYGEDPSPKIGRISMNYDRAWIAAVKYAIKQNKPVLGICRGMQLVNVALGGSLHQDIADSISHPIIHSQHQVRDYPMHKVYIEKDSLLYNVIGEDEIYTNTMHHQCVKKIGDGLQVCAKTSDGVIESLCKEDGSVLLVQWHPEELQDSVIEMRKIFEYLVNKSNRTNE